jgi:uncharacterized membrane protein
MQEVPEFWRTEIWHPLSVHLPLAILLVASLFYITGFFFRKKSWENTSIILLLVGIAGAWIAIYTGNLADGVVSRQICDPTVLKTHENNAYIVAWLFSAASIIILAEYFGTLKKIRKIAKILVLVLVMTGSGFLFYTGHLGATLVYQQAAGVYVPTEDCSEFE